MLFGVLKMRLTLFVCDQNENGGHGGEREVEEEKDTRISLEWIFEEVIVTRNENFSSCYTHAACRFPFLLLLLLLLLLLSISSFNLLSLFSSQRGKERRTGN